MEFSVANTHTYEDKQLSSDAQINESRNDKELLKHFVSMVRLSRCSSDLQKVFSFLKFINDDENNILFDVLPLLAFLWRQLHNDVYR